MALTYSDENGVFKSADLSAGSYFLNLTFMGYAPKNIPFSVSRESPVVEIGTIYLKPEATQLNAVTVTGTRQLVEQQPGMLIYNAEKDISNQGGTAADVLRKAPILNVDAAGQPQFAHPHQRKIFGSNGPERGRCAEQDARQFDQIRGSDHQSRYDAEGVINIITKKRQQKVSGTVEVVVGNLKQAVNPRISSTETNGTSARTSISTVCETGRKLPSTD